MAAPKINGKLPDGVVKGYCMKEKKKGRKIIDAKLKKMKKTGALAAQGKCKECGTGMYKILGADDKSALGIK